MFRERALPTHICGWLSYNNVGFLRKLINFISYKNVLLIWQSELPEYLQNKYNVCNFRIYVYLNVKWNIDLIFVKIYL